MKKLSGKQINEMAQHLECGLTLYVNRKTMEVRELMSAEDALIGNDHREEERQEIETTWEDYFIIEKPSSRDGYHIMADFVREVEEQRLREDLINILNRRSPFANFKAEIDASKYGEAWFAFKTKKQEEYVKEYLDSHDVPYESS